MKLVNIQVIIALIYIFLAQTHQIPVAMIPHKGELVSSSPPEFRIDLNVDPYHRWDHIIPTYKPAIQSFFTKLLDLIPIPFELYEKVGDFASKTPLYNEFVQEIKGIADMVEVPWQKLLVANFFYDISTILPEATICTSIVAKNKDGKVIHGRNLDFWPWSLFSKLSAKVKVYRGNKYIAEFDQIIGSVFVLSGQKYDKFSITVDTRKFINYTKGGISKLLTNIFILKQMPSAFLTRNVLQTEDIDYEGAINMLKNTKTTSPIYYIVGGIDKGSVIEKNPIGVHGFYEIGPDSSEWYIVQTNYDRFQDPGEDQRRIPAEERLNEIGQNNITTDVLFNEVMVKYPNLNIASIYTSIFMPSESINKLSMWYGNIDDWSPDQPIGLRGTKTSNFYDKDSIVNDSVAKQFLSSQQLIDLSNQLLDLSLDDLITEINI